MSLTSIVMAWLFWTSVAGAVYGMIAFLWCDKITRHNKRWGRWLDSQKYLTAIYLNVIACMILLFVADVIDCHAAGNVYRIFGRNGLPGCVG